ncbi:glutamate--tRNA ligase family protein [Candidatus Vidania fulgoroideorum]
MIKNFIINKINIDILKNLKIKLITRFAPEPSGYIHLGHLKCIYINYIISKLYKGEFIIRIDDTNPVKCIVNCMNIIYDIYKFFNFKYFYKSSDRINFLYKLCKRLIKHKKSYVDSTEYCIFKINKGSYNTKGNKSPFLCRNNRENLYLFKKMKKGLFFVKECAIRIKTEIYDNINYNDPVILRIKFFNNKFYLSPSYDFSNSILDSVDKINYSICTKEFEYSNILYRYFIKLFNKINKIKQYPKQLEFSKLEIKNVFLSKRLIKKTMDLLEIKKWSDPRLFTIIGLIKRGFDKKTLLDFVIKTGFSKSKCLIDFKCIKKIFIKNNKNICRFNIYFRRNKKNINLKLIFFSGSNIKKENFNIEKKLYNKLILCKIVIFENIGYFKKINNVEFNEIFLF